jgi:small conductance mechanosensitive channel
MFEFIKGIVTSDKFYLPIIYIVLGIILYIFISSMIKRISKFSVMNHSKGVDKRKATIVVLINNIIKYIIAIIVVMAILGVYGVNTTSIIASLGVVGVVVGLAFQDIVKDFLAGIFIIFDNEYAVGDWVEINGFVGEVISLGLKTTKIKAYNGEVKILSNSSFSEVTNYNLSNDNLIISIPVSYNIDIDKLEKVLKGIIPSVCEIKNVINMSLLGIDSFDDSSMKYAISVECRPMTQYSIKRAVLKIIKQEFDKNKIVIPYNQLDIHIEK